jgi:hypothetical protein
LDNRKNKPAGPNGNSDKNPDEKKSALSGASGKTPMVPEPETDDTRTRQFLQEKVREGILSRGQDESEPVFSKDGEEAFSFRRVKKQSPYRPLLLILGIVLVIFFALFIYQIIRSHQNTLVLKKAAAVKSGQNSNAEFLKSLENRASEPGLEARIRQFVFPDNIFQGEAFVQDDDRVFHFSPQKDAEMASLADAMNIRARILFGIKTSSRGESITESCSGTFNGFRISSLLVRQAGQIIRDEISVLTPSRGGFKVVGKSLESVSRTDPDLLVKDLEKSAITTTVSVSPEDHKLQLQLRIAGSPAGRVPDAHLIAGNAVGDIVLDSGISGLKSRLTPGCAIIKRKIMVENEFEFIYKIEDQRRTPLFYIYERNSRIWGIQIVDERFKTDRGLGIGSSLGAMRIYYTRVNIVSVPGKLNYLWIDQENLKQLKFILSDDRRIDFDSQNFPFDIKINSILIGKSPVLN